MATVTKDFRVKAGLVVEGATATVEGHDILTKKIVDAKGDLLVGTADNAVSRVAVGTNGYVLTADSAETGGLKWAAPAAVGSFESSIVFEGATANDHETTLAVTDPTADRTITLPDATGTVALTSDIPSLSGYVTESGTQTLTNKTLTSPAVSGLSITDGSFVVEGATANEFETTVQFTDPTQDRTITIPNVTGTVVTTGDTGSVTNTMLAGSIANEKLTNSAITINGTSTALGGSRTLGTDDVSEGSTNKYFTDERAQDAIGTVVGNGLSYDDTTGAISVNTSTIQARVTDVSDTEIGYLNGVTSAIQTQIDNKASLSGATFTGAVSGTSLVLSGDLTVNGTTTTINSTEITIDDKNLVLGSVATPTDAGADGGGLTLKGATDKTLNWVDATDSWTSSEHLDLASGKVLKVAGTQVLSATEYTGNAATVTNGVYTTSKISALAATSSSELAGVISDETGTGALVFANTPTLVTPAIGAATGTSLVLSGALTGTAVNFDNTVVGSNTGTAGTSTTNIDAWAVSTYSAAKYIIQMKKSGNIEVIEMLVAVDGDNNVYVTEYADVISNTELGTTNAVYADGSVVLQVTAAAADTAVKVHKIYIEA